MLLPIIPAEGELLDVISKLQTAIFNSISNKPANYYDSLVKLTSQILHVPSENVHRKFDKNLQEAKISLLSQQTQLIVPQPTPLTHQLSITQLVQPSENKTIAPTKSAKESVSTTAKKKSKTIKPWVYTYCNGIAIDYIYTSRITTSHNFFYSHTIYNMCPRNTFKRNAKVHYAVL